MNRRETENMETPYEYHTFYISPPPRNGLRKREKHEKALVKQRFGEKVNLT